MIEVRAFKLESGQRGVALLREAFPQPVWYCYTGDDDETLDVVGFAVDILNDLGMTVKVSVHADMAELMVSRVRRRYAAGMN
ncbi:MAG: hypothetical protein JXJ17_04425 [Anaerolineae bacterium]|nr:hypothetical protein [Anaerolineae bacterium]